MTIDVSPARPSAKGMLRAPHQIVALAGGLGLARHWPGTWGSLAGVGLFAALLPLPVFARGLCYAILLVVAAWAARRTGEDLGDPDHNAIVADEVLGMALTLEAVANQVWLWPVAFALFRFFDAVKPWPIRLAHERFAGGFAVMLDDVLAAGAAAAVLLAATLLLPGLAP